MPGRTRTGATFSTDGGSYRFMNTIQRTQPPREARKLETSSPPPPHKPPERGPTAAVRRRRLAAGAVVVILAGIVMAWLVRGRESPPPPPEEVRGTSEWAMEHYGDPDTPRFMKRRIVEIDFLGRSMFVHRGARRHFLRLARLFEARAPEYAAAVALGELDDWSYENRDIRGEDSKSSHAFGIAVDINALANPLGTVGDIPEEVVQGWEAEGGEWGGDWSRPDPMHFETHLTPSEIRDRYRPDGSPRDWYLEQLIGG
jgi:hypothetical protein